jgi:hypothetical protein
MPLPSVQQSYAFDSVTSPLPGTVEVMLFTEDGEPIFVTGDDDKRCVGYLYVYFKQTAAQNTRRCEGRRIAIISGSDWRLLFRPLTVSGFLST